MLKLLAGRLACFRGKHERNGDKIRNIGSEDYRSTCLYCGIPMKRLAKRKWIVTPKAER